VTSSQPTSFLSEVAAGDHAISQNTLAYLQARAKSRLYDYILRKFAEQEEHGLTRAQLARRIGKSPEVVTRLLGAPGNWTIDTVSDLLVGISSEELKPDSERLLDRPRRNYPGKKYTLPEPEARAETGSATRVATPAAAAWATATTASVVVTVSR
jgi:hypothetical protein